MAERSRPNDMDAVSKPRLLATIHADRARFERAVISVPRELLAMPMLAGGWSVKDVLAHIAWTDREALRLIRARALVKSDLSELAQDERNEVVVRQSRASGIDAVVNDYRAAFDEFVAALDGLTEEQLNDPQTFAGLPERLPRWRPWRALYDPNHYEDHRRPIEMLSHRVRVEDR